MGTRLGPWDEKLVFVTRVHVTRIGLSSSCALGLRVYEAMVLYRAVYMDYSGTDVLSCIAAPYTRRVHMAS